MNYLEVQINELDLSCKREVCPDDSIVYVPISPIHFEYFARLVNFFCRLISSFQTEWIIDHFYKLLISLDLKLHSNFRITGLYVLINSLVVDQYSAFFLINQISDPCVLVVLKIVEFTIKAQVEFNDELLICSLNLIISIPSEVINKLSNELKQKYVSILIKSLKLGLVDSALAKQALMCVQEWVAKDISFLPKILVGVFPYLKEVKSLKIMEKNENCFVRVERPNSTSNNFSEIALNIIGNCGIHAHQAIHMQNKKTPLLVKKLGKHFEFNFKTEEEAIGFYLDELIEEILGSVNSCENSLRRIRSIELLHSTIRYLIGSCGKAGSFLGYFGCYERLIPAMLRLATDIDNIPKNLFDSLCKQLIRWLAIKVIDQSEITSILDYYIDAATNPNSESLRLLGCNCLSIFLELKIQSIKDTKNKEIPQIIIVISRKFHLYVHHSNLNRRYGLLTWISLNLEIIKDSEIVSNVLIFDLLIDLIDLSVCCSMHNTVYRSLFDKAFKRALDIIRSFKDTLYTPNKQRENVKDLNDLILKSFKRLMSQVPILRQTSFEVWSKILKIFNFSGHSWIIEEYERNTDFEKEIKIEELNLNLNFDIIYNEIATQCNFLYYLLQEINPESKKIQMLMVKWAELINSNVAKLLVHILNDESISIPITENIEAKLGFIINLANYLVFMKTKFFISIIEKCNCEKFSKYIINLILHPRINGVISTDMKGYELIKEAIGNLISKVLTDYPNANIFNILVNQILNSKVLKYLNEEEKEDITLLDTRLFFESLIKLCQIFEELKEKCKIPLEKILNKCFEKIQISNSNLNYKICAYYIIRILKEPTALMKFILKFEPIDIKEELLTRILCEFFEEFISYFFSNSDQPEYLKWGQIILEELYKNKIGWSDSFFKHLNLLIKAKESNRESQLKLILYGYQFLSKDASKDILSLEIHNKILDLIEIYITQNPNVEIMRISILIIANMASLKIGIDKIENNLCEIIMDLINAGKNIKNVGTLKVLQKSDETLIIDSICNYLQICPSIASFHLIIECIRLKMHLSLLNFSTYINNFCEHLSKVSKPEFVELFNWSLRHLLYSYPDEVIYIFGDKFSVLDLIIKLIEKSKVEYTSACCLSFWNSWLLLLNDNTDNSTRLLESKLLILSIIECLLKKYSENPENQQLLSFLVDDSIYKKLIFLFSNVANILTSKSDNCKNTEYSYESDLWKSTTYVVFNCTIEILLAKKEPEATISQILFCENDSSPSLISLIIPLKEIIQLPIETNFPILSLTDYISSSSNLDSIPKEKNTENIRTFIEPINDTKLTLLSLFEVDPSQKEQNNQENSCDIELDILNKHPCMKKIIKYINLIQANIIASESPPRYLKIFNDILSSNDIHINIRTFVARILTNYPQGFSMYSEKCFVPLLKYAASAINLITEPFNYMIRDICTLFLSWNLIPSKELKESENICSELLNKLIRSSCNKAKFIFTTHMKIVGSLCEKWSSHVHIDESTILTMLNNTNTANSIGIKQNLCALQTITFALHSNVPIKNNKNEIVDLIKSEIIKGIFTKMSSTKKAVAASSAECIGLILTTNANSLIAKEVVQILCFLLDAKISTLRGIIASSNVIEKYPLIIETENFLSILLQKFEFTWTEPKIILLTIFTRYINSSQSNLHIASIVTSLFKQINILVHDKNLGVHSALISTFLALKTKSIGSFPNLLKKYFDGIQIIVNEIQDENFRFKFYELIRISFRNFVELKERCKIYIIEGCNDLSPTVSATMINFLCNDYLVEFSPLERISFFVQELFVPEIGNKWVYALINILLLPIVKSKLGSTKLFNSPLEAFKFSKVPLKRIVKSSLWSQPMAPFFMKNESDTQENLKCKEKKKKVELFSQNIDQNMLGSFQLPKYTQCHSSQLSQEMSINPSQSNLIQEEIFKIPKSVKEMNKPGLKEFLRENNLIYGMRIDNSLSSQSIIRFTSPVGYVGSSRIIRDIRSNLIDNEEELKTVREYRQGEFPDIELEVNDILDPMLNLCSLSKGFSSEVLTQIIVCLFKNSLNEKKGKIIKIVEKLFDFKIENSDLYFVRMMLQILSSIESMGFVINIDPNKLYFLADKNMILSLGINSGEESLLSFDKNKEDFSQSPKKSLISMNPFKNPNVLKIYTLLNIAKMQSKLKNLDSNMGIWNTLLEPDILKILYPKGNSKYFEHFVDSYVKNDLVSALLFFDQKNEEGSLISKEAFKIEPFILNELTNWDLALKKLKESDSLDYDEKKLYVMSKFKTDKEVNCDLKIFEDMPYEKALYLCYNGSAETGLISINNYLNSLSTLCEAQGLQQHGFQQYLIESIQKGIMLKKHIIKLMQIQNDQNSPLINIKEDMSHYKDYSFQFWEDIVFSKHAIFNQIHKNNPHSKYDCFSLLGEISYKKSLYNTSLSYNNKALQLKEYSEDKYKISSLVALSKVKLLCKLNFQNKEKCISEIQRIMKEYDKALENYNNNQFKSKLNFVRSRLMYISYEESLKGNIDTMGIQILFSSIYMIKSCLEDQVYMNSCNTKEKSSVYLNYSKCLNELLTYGKELGDKIKQETASDFVETTLSAINLNYLKSFSFIPTLFHVLNEYHDSVAEIFKKKILSVPSWMYLPWVGQIIVSIRGSSSITIKPLIDALIKEFPQQFFFAFNVAYSNYLIYSSEDEKQIEEFNDIIHQLNNFKNLHSFQEGLNCLTHPEHRFKYWMDLIKELISNDNLTSNLLSSILINLKSDLFTEKENWVGKKIGRYNMKFISLWAKHLEENLFKFKYTNDLKSKNELLNLINNLNKNIMNGISSNPDGLHKLVTFSEWLDLYSLSIINRPQDILELPGQLKWFKEPIKEELIKITSFSKTLKVLPSIRKPKKLDIIGSNEKIYSFLIKGGEDLRQDERIMQLFMIMNQIILRRNISDQSNQLKTFQIIPISNRLGIIEWIDQTETFKDLICNYSQYLEQDFNSPRDIKKFPSSIKRLEWLNLISSGKQLLDQHLKVLELDSNTVVSNFQTQSEINNNFMLKRCIESQCLMRDQYIVAKQRFIKSYATLSASMYILGIGDRHLENYLLDRKDGNIIGIDFGISFGAGIHLPIPEFVEMRLTPQIEGIAAPEGLKGLFSISISHVLDCFFIKKQIILDICNIFIKDPIWEWGKNIKLTNEDSQKIQVFKIDIVKRKLDGVDPSELMLEELEISKHKTRNYYKNIYDAISKHKLSKQQNNSKSEVYCSKEIVNSLISKCTDKNLLGRMWFGWFPLF